MSSTLMLSVSTIEPNAKSKPFIITPNLRSILARLLGPTCQVLSHRHPWTELVDHTAFAKPAPFSNATSQMVHWGLDHQGSEPFSGKLFVLRQVAFSRKESSNSYSERAFPPWKHETKRLFPLASVLSYNCHYICFYLH
ncbi:hypothetical protein QQP08_011962 [Theobroma cacao]|nr:hypothetical protein QQP08_011962 [Theobroma cacao]